MIIAELRKALESFADEQNVYLRLCSNAYPQGAQVIIQGVGSTPPWHAEAPDRVWLLAHDQTKELLSKLKDNHD